MEDLPGNSLRMTVDHKTLKILPRGVNLSRRNAASMIVLEIAEWFDLQLNFLILDKAKALPIRIGNQTVWELKVAVWLDFIDNKDKIIAKDYELHGRCDFLYYAL